MIKLLYTILFCFVLYGCKPSNEVIDTNITTFPLTFTDDTLLFDTLIATGNVSITKRLIVYNTSSKAIRINEISIGNKAASPFSMYVNGQKGFSFHDVELFGNDSILILVNVTLSPSNIDTPFVITDSLHFNVNNFTSKVILNTWGQDAYFHVNETLANNVTLPNNKPHVFYGSYLVDSLAELTITKNTTLLFYNGCGFYVKGKLIINGTNSEKVVFKAFRQDSKYETLPGQWKGIIVDSKDKSHKFSWVTISNAEYGVYVNKNASGSISINNSFISNVSKSCFTSYDAVVTLSNSVFYRSMSGLLNISGGELNAYNNTFTNIASGFGGNVASVSIDDNFKALKLNFINNIVWGNVPNEFFVKFSKSQLVDLVIKKNILKISELAGYSDNILLSDMNKFKFKNVSLNIFTPDILSATPLVLSPAQDSAEIIPGLTDVEDYGGHLRDSTPDIGAIEILK